MSASESCQISLPSKELKHARFDILAYIQPDELVEESIITNLCLAEIHYQNFRNNINCFGGSGTSNMSLL